MQVDEEVLVFLPTSSKNCYCNRDTWKNRTGRLQNLHGRQRSRLRNDDGEADDELCNSPGHERKESVADLRVSDKLSVEEKTEMHTLLNSNEDASGVTILGDHYIRLTTKELIVEQSRILLHFFLLISCVNKSAR